MSTRTLPIRGLAVVAAALGLAMLVHMSKFSVHEEEEASTNSLLCFVLRTENPTRHLQRRRKNELLTKVLVMPERIAQLSKAHAHDADGQWPAEAVYELGDLQRTLDEARCFSYGSDTAQLVNVEDQLEPLLAHAGLLGHSNRTASLNVRSRVQPLEAAQDSSGGQHGDNMQDIHHVHGPHPAMGYAYA